MLRRTLKRQLQAERLESRCVLSATVFEHNDIGYFVDDDSASLQRYDIANETWLSPVTLAGAPGTPTAALVDDDGIYAAFGKSAYRYDLDGSDQTHLINLEYNIIGIHTDGNLLFLNDSSGLYARLVSINKTSNTVIDDFENYVDAVVGSSISPETNRIFGRTAAVSPSDITYASYNDTGIFISGGGSPYHGDYPSASRTWVFDGGTQVVDDSGTVYATNNLVRLGSFATKIHALDFTDDGAPIVLNGQKLTAFTSQYLPTGSATVSGAATEIFVNDANIIAFTPDSASATGFDAELVPLADLQPPTPGEPVDPVGLSYKPDKIELTSDGQLLLFSKANNSIFRWDPAVQNYGPTIPLIGAPSFMTYSGTTNTAYVAYGSGLIYQIDLSAANPVEVPFANLATSPIGLSTAGQYVFAVDGSGAWVSHFTFAPDGTQIDAVDWNYSSTEYVWNDANQKMYFFRDDTSPNDLLWEEINANGSTYLSQPPGGIGGKQDSPLHTSSGFVHPIRVSPDGSIVVLGSGVIHNAKTLARLTGGLANSITDATWMEGELFTVRNIAGVTQYQRWSQPTYGQDDIAQTSGTALALKTVSSTRLLGIGRDDAGVPTFTLLDAELNVLAEANTAPLLDNSGDPELTAILEDALNPAGTLVADLIAGAVADADAAARQGIAVTAASSFHGQWQYTTNGGASWQAMGAASLVAARLLPGDDQTRVRFLPKLNFNGAVKLYYRAWDQTEGFAGQTFDLTGKLGGRHAFSKAFEGATHAVAAVNDAPVLNTSLSPMLPSLAEDTKFPAGTPVWSLIQGAVSDPDIGAVRGIAVTGASTFHGLWQFKLSGGPWQAMGEVSSDAALLLPANAQVRFIPRSDFHGTVKLWYRAWDQTQGTAGETFNLSGKLGGTNAFSSALESAALVVTPVNDKPVLRLGGTLGYTSDAAAITLASGATVQDVDSANFFGGQLRVWISAGESTSNRLVIGAGFTVDANNNVLQGETIIGKRTSNGFGTKELIITFNSNATPSIAQQLARAIAFKTVGGAAGQRTILFTVSDGDGGLSDEALKTVNVT